MTGPYVWLEPMPRDETPEGYSTWLLRDAVRAARNEGLTVEEILEEVESAITEIEMRAWE